MNVLTPWTLALLGLGYLGLVFAIAWYGDRAAARGRHPVPRPLVYTLSLAVYCTSWAYYGTVGQSAATGWWLPPTYIGTIALFAMSRVIDADTPYALILGLHVVLMVSLASIFTPMFTLGLGSLTPELYSHGSSILGTLQQVAGAVGTAAIVVILENRSKSLVSGGASADQAFVGGLQWAFVAGAIFGAVVIALSLLLPAKADLPEGPAH